MNNMRNKILSLLVLLMTAVSGAWAQKQITITQGFEDGMGDWTTNHCHNSTGISNSYGGYESSYSFRFYYTPNAPQYLISPELDENDGGTMSFYYARYSSNYNESFKVGYSTTTSEPSAFTWGNEVTSTNTYSDSYLEYTYDIPAGAKYVSIACTSNDQFYFFVDDIKIEYAPAEAPTDVEVTTNKAEGETTFTEATFAMPAFDATVNYDIVRDMAVQMTTTVGGVTDNSDYRIRLKKKDDKWEPADLTVAQVMGKFKVHDALENKDLTFYGEGAVCSISIYALDDQDQPTGEAIAFADLVPGRYVAIATAADGTAYDGQTPQSNVLVLFQGYEVTVPSKEFITYYKDEPLYADTETSADAELYTISSVSGNQATLSSAIETAPSNTPLLVYNKGNEDKTFLLIPTDQEPNLQLIVYPGFIGTLTATTIAASTTDQTNFALNGKQFVYVKNALAIGANKAYLSIQNSNARQISLVFDNEATGIQTSKFTKETNSEWYTIDGRKVTAPTKKGVYIQNGKKVVVK